MTRDNKEHIDIGAVQLQMNLLWWQPIVTTITENSTNGSAVEGPHWSASNPLRVYVKTLSYSAHFLIISFNEWMYKFVFLHSLMIVGF